MGLIGSEVAKDILAIQEVIFLDSDAHYAVGPRQPVIQDIALGDVAMVQYCLIQPDFPRRPLSVVTDLLTTYGSTQLDVD